MGKGKVSKILCIMLSLMLVIGMAPANSSYAASRGLGNTISSWFNSIKGSSNNKGSSSSDKVTNNITTLESTTTSDSSGTAKDIVLTKTATDKGTDSDGNQLFDITLGVKGRQVSSARPIDITLVIDTSGSMSHKDKMKDTKTAAKNFVDSVLTTGSLARISVVKFANHSSAGIFDSSGKFTSGIFNDGYDTNITGNDSYYSQIASEVKKAIDKLSASGGTNTESGAVMAKKVTDSRNRSEADSIVIFLTDGEPTYYSNGTTYKQGGNGEICSNDCFDKAVTAFKTLKGSGASVNQLYSIGFLTDYTTNGNQYKICEALLSDSVYNKANIRIKNDKYNSVSFTPQTNQSANFTKYYGIKQGDNATTKINSIYTELAQRINALASGTIVDKIPDGFELTADAIAAIEANPNATYDATNKTVTYINVEAGANQVNNTFEVKYTGNGYGSAYTNVSATYSGTLYNGTTFSNLEFDKPVAGLHPKTREDKDSTVVDEEITVDVANNDQFTKLTVDGYEVSDYTIVLTDKDGKEISYTGDFTATIKDGKLVFTSTTEGTKELYYVVKANITKVGDDFATNGKTELKSQPTKVTIDVYNAPSKAFVIDFGKPVTYSVDDVFTATEQNAQIVLKNATNNKATGNYGTMTFNSDKSITYKLTKFMDNIDQFIFNETFTDKAKVDKKVSMVPASSIYYEDNFSDENGNTVITYDDVWTTVSKNELGDTITDIMGDGNTGYDTNYNKDDSKLSYSAGSIHMVTAPSDKTVKASFEFTGTGVDIYSLTNGHTGKIQVAIWKQKEDGTYPSTAVYRKTIDTKYNSGTAYQLPVVNFDSEEDAAAKYKVQITVAKGNTYYLDAVRIYNPVGNLEKYDSESGCKYVSIRNQSLSPSIFTVKGNVFIDSYLDKDADVITLDSNISEEDLNIYKNYGRKTEVIIAPDQEVSIKLNKSYGLVQLGARIDALAPNSVAGGDANGSVTANGSPIGINSSTDMYYTISSTDNGLINIKNNTSKLISITKLKLK